MKKLILARWLKSKDHRVEIPFKLIILVLLVWTMLLTTATVHNSVVTRDELVLE